ncbi:MAG: hypothetical protein IJL25_01885, partial [Clostridia bacterium]|nr:hypothetical protein [Clostridia bacterium]
MPKTIDITWYSGDLFLTKITRKSGITRLKIRYASSFLCHPYSSKNLASIWQSSRPSGLRGAGINQAKSGQKSSSIPSSFFWSFFVQARLVNRAGTISENCLKKDERPSPLT